MLKLRLDKVAYATLSDDWKKEYKAEGEGFVLDTDVKFEDVTPLKTALEHEKTHRKTATEKVTTLEAEKATLEARAGGIGALETSYKDKIAKQEADHKAELLKRDTQLRKVLVDDEALKIAADIFVNPTLGLPHVASRLRMEDVDGSLICRVLDKDGKPSAASVNDLRTELLANPDLKPIIAASKASGSGAQGGKGAGAGGSKKYAEMSESERTALAKDNKPEFSRLREEWKAAGSPAATPPAK